MALIHCNFYSEVLEQSTEITVILPQTAKLHPTLYLLHGLSDDHTAWLRKTSIERYVEGKDLAVVMPAVYRGFYTDMAVGRRYWTYVSEELPRIARAMFPLSPKREENFAAGLSMGGYGAFKLALSKPDCFAAAASLSGALDIAFHANTSSNLSKAEWQSIFGDLEKIQGSGNDLLHLADQVIKSGAFIPRLYQWCGTEDFLYQDNLNFVNHAKAIGLEVAYEEGRGDHTWPYWDRQIQRVIEWMGI